MGTELIRGVFVRPDGVYLNSKSDNDDRPFNTWKCDSLTDIYRQEGQPGLDREIVRMLYEYAQIQGAHSSVERYRPCLREWGIHSRPFVQAISAEYDRLTQEDKNTVWLPDEKKTDAAKAYEQYRRKAEDDMYTRLAQLASEPGVKKPPPRGIGAR